MRRLAAWLISIAARPFQQWHWAAAQDDRVKQRWANMVSHLEALHAWYWENDVTRFQLACGYAHVGRLGDAVDEFRKMGAPLADAVCEDQRKLTLAGSLYRLGRYGEALEALGDGTDEWTSEEYRADAERLRQEAQPRLEFEQATWPHVQRAARAQQWDTVLRLLGPLHQQGIGTCETLLMAAWAHSMRSEWEGCLAMLEQIGPPEAIPFAEVRAEALWMTALALMESGRSSEHDELVSRLRPEDCPAHIRSRLARHGVYESGLDDPGQT